MNKSQLFSLFCLFLLLVVIIDDGVSSITNTRLAGSMLEAQNRGFFNAPMFTGYLEPSHKLRKRFIKKNKINKWTAGTGFKYNLYAYKNGIKIPQDEKWIHYTSAFRLNMFIARTIDYMLFKVTGNHDNIRTINLILSIFSLVLLFFFIIWVSREFGRIPSILLSVVLCFNQIVFEFGDYHSFWILFTPFLYLLYQFQKFPRNEFKLNLKNGFVLGLLIMSNAMTSYEFVPTMITSLLVPISFYGYKNNWPLQKIFLKSLQIVIFSTLTVLVVILLHFGFLSVTFGGIDDSIAYLKQRFLMRTYDIDSDVQRQLKGTRRLALKKDLSEVLLSFIKAGKGIYGVKEIYWMLAFATIILFTKIEKFRNLVKIKNSRIYVALGICCFIGFMAGLVRPIVFKSHAAQPAHQLFIVDSWNIPFKIFVITAFIVILSDILKGFWDAEKTKIIKNQV